MPVLGQYLIFLCRKLDEALLLCDQLVDLPMWNQLLLPTIPGKCLFWKLKVKLVTILYKSI